MILFNDPLTLCLKESNFVVAGNITGFKLCLSSVTVTTIDLLSMSGSMVITSSSSIGNQMGIKMSMK